MSSAAVRSGQVSSTMQPRASKVARCASSTARTRASSGSPPRSGAQATRSPRRSRARSPRRSAGSDRSQPGSRGSGPAITPSRKATSATERAIGPFTPKPSRGNGSGAVGTRPTDGRSATTLLKLAGLRSEPPRSLPSAMGSMPRGQRRAGAAARSAGALGEVVGVPRGAVDLVVGVRAESELRHVGLADAERSGVPQAFDQHGVGRSRRGRA